MDLISCMTKVAAPGALIDIPMNATTDLYVRSHYNGMTLVLPDTPMLRSPYSLSCESRTSKRTRRRHDF
jgi:hypothetical protein